MTMLQVIDDALTHPLSGKYRTLLIFRFVKVVVCVRKLVLSLNCGRMLVSGHGQSQFDKGRVTTLALVASTVPNHHSSLSSSCLFSYVLFVQSGLISKTYAHMYPSLTIVVLVEFALTLRP